MSGNGHTPTDPTLDEMFPPIPVPALSIEYERRLLSALLFDAESLPRVRKALTSADFERPIHRAVFAALEQLAGEGIPISVEALVAQLERRGDLERIGGLPAISHLIESVPKGAPVEFWIGEIAQGALRRRTLAILAQAHMRNVDAPRLREIIRDATEAAAGEPDLPRAVNLYDPSVKATRPDFVVSNLIRKSGLHMVWAPPGGLKTWSLLRGMHELLLVDGPSHLFGHPGLGIHRRYKRVLWIATEETAGGLRAKADMVLRGLQERGQEKRELGGELLYHFAATSRRRITLQDLPEILEAEGPLDAVVLDSLTGLRPKIVDGQRVKWDLDNDATNELCLAIRALAEEHHVAVFLVHHTGRDQGKGYRGPTDWWASADVVFGLLPQDGGLVKVQVEKNRDGAVLPPFVLKPSWGVEGFYLTFEGAAPTAVKMTPAEKRADEFLRSVQEASQAEIMEAAEIKARDTIIAIAKRRVEAGAWQQAGTRASGSPVFRHVSAKGVDGVE